MKKAMFAMLLALSPTANATKLNWTGTLVGSQDIVVYGSFDYDETAPVIWETNDTEIHGGALSNFSLILNQDIYTRSMQWDAMVRGQEISFQDANLDGTDDANEFSWNPDGWCLELWSSANHAATDMFGKVISVYRDAYFPESTVVTSVAFSHEPEHDAAPTPEPSTWMLLVSGLGLMALRLRIKK